MDSLDCHGFLPNLQHDFQIERSCEIQLASSVIQDLTCSARSRCHLVTIILDFSKAFSMISHKRLLNKLSSSGVRLWLGLETSYPIIINWSSYMVWFRGRHLCCATRHRLQLVVVPEYITDLQNNFKSTVHLFAKDYILYRAAKSIHDCNVLQEDLLLLTQWERHGRCNSM